MTPHFFETLIESQIMALPLDELAQTLNPALCRCM